MGEGGSCLTLGPTTKGPLPCWGPSLDLLLMGEGLVSTQVSWHHSRRSAVGGWCREGLRLIPCCPVDPGGQRTVCPSRDH